jgi:hypothetical protein
MRHCHVYIEPDPIFGRDLSVEEGRVATPPLPTDLRDPGLAGLTPGFAGLYQVNVSIPEALPAGGSGN